MILIFNLIYYVFKIEIFLEQKSCRNTHKNTQRYFFAICDIKTNMMRTTYYFMKVTSIIIFKCNLSVFLNTHIGKINDFRNVRG